MSSNREQFTAARDALLTKITAFLKDDPRFLAAWLAGSFGRGEQTWVSDLDLHVVVAEAYSEALCAAPWPAGGRTTPERLALFQQFGTPAIIYEAHSNNLVGGTFTHVVYRESGQNIDWMLIPQHKAHQEHQSLLLFAKVGIPEAPEPEPLTREKAVQTASDAVGFFWMIAAGAAKGAKGDMINFHILLSWLKDSIDQVKYAHEFKVPPFRRNRLEICYTQAEQATALRKLCDEMETLMPAVVAFGGYVPAEPCIVVEKLLALFEDQ
ncbi:hypothetical protein EPA93_09340 [Ktedonosporobacter rubrisoli]|uniref:Uncharacterized protein n=1 Tax=Ktedonosporobacter rubrisoli TaxID=2509675 RepID=A0A4P6JM73_KTERU|nr:DUF294 nucleotidyltransferase-like domain-containing protein [Ktedonosporobacter rubrisoli]QBD76203.1 hypothetical protein EPA93_09340 [Ktedonosporobacter rubrisoli]